MQPFVSYFGDLHTGSEIRKHQANLSHLIQHRISAALAVVGLLIYIGSKLTQRERHRRGYHVISHEVGNLDGPFRGHSMFARVQKLERRKQERLRSSET